ncbi:MAG: hypothetical protein AAFQ79_07380 [Pseudomonadota bacterium]
MTYRIVLAMALTAAIAGCAQVRESRVNPFNWFGQDEEVTVVETRVITDPRPLVAQISSVSIDPAPGGAILRVVGLPERQGYFAGALVQEAAPAGVLAYSLRAVPPAEATRTSTPASRELVMAVFLSDQTLAGVRQIQVSGASNARAIRR